MNDIILTRYLYIKDEVKYSILISLLLKQTFQQVIFWIEEFYTSGYKEELWKFLFTIYYDFYASRNPRLEKYMIKLYKRWKQENNIIQIINFVKNLYNKNTDAYVFKLRLCIKEFEKNKSKKQCTIYNKRLFQKQNRCYKELFKTIDKKYHNLFISIVKENIYNVAYHIYRLCSTNQKDELNSVIERIIEIYHCGRENSETGVNKKKVYENNINHDNDNENTTKIDSQKSPQLCKKVNLKKNRKYKYIFQNNLYENQLHLLLVSLRHNTMDDTLINNRNIFIKLQDYNTYNSNNIITSKEEIKEKRYYTIPDEIGMFKLNRYKYIKNNNYNLFKREILRNWQYYAYRSPFWRERIDYYKGYFEETEIPLTQENIETNQKIRTITLYNLEFQNDDLQKEFYQLYNYEMDEQDNETIEKSLKELQPMEIEDNEMNVPYDY